LAFAPFRCNATRNTWGIPYKDLSRMWGIAGSRFVHAFSPNYFPHQEQMIFIHTACQSNFLSTLKQKMHVVKESFGPFILGGLLDRR